MEAQIIDLCESDDGEEDAPSTSTNVSCCDITSRSVLNISSVGMMGPISKRYEDTYQARTVSPAVTMRGE